MVTRYRLFTAAYYILRKLLNFEFSLSSYSCISFSNYLQYASFFFTKQPKLLT